MKKVLITSFFVLLTVVESAHAGRQVDVKHINFKDWGGKKPNVVTLVSNTSQRMFPPIFFQRFINWFDASGNAVPELAAELCRINEASGTKCINQPSGLSEVVSELYLGDPGGIDLIPKASPSTVGMKSLSELPPGAKKVIYATVIRQREFTRYALAVAYDDISDQDLRRILYEDGVLCILGYREDCATSL